MTSCLVCRTHTGQSPFDSWTGCLTLIRFIINWKSTLNLNARVMNPYHVIVPKYCQNTVAVHILSAVSAVLYSFRVVREIVYSDSQ